MLSRFIVDMLAPVGVFQFGVELTDIRQMICETAFREEFRDVHHPSCWPTPPAKAASRSTASCGPFGPESTEDDVEVKSLAQRE